MTKNMKIRNFPLIIIGMLMVSAILYSAMTIRPASAAVTNGVFLVPQETTLTNANVGTLFNLNVSIANVTGFAGVEWHLTWNSTLMNCTSIVENLYATVTPTEEQDNIWKISLKKDNVAGEATYAVTYQDLSRAQDGGYCPINVTSADYPQGLVTAILTFNVTLVPPVNSYYDCIFNFTKVNVGDVLAQDLNITGQNGQYRIYGPPETTNTQISFEGHDYTVTTATNASLVPDSVAFAKLSDSSYKLDFNLTGTDGDTAYVNVTVPKALMTIGATDSWIVDVNGVEATPIVTSDATNWYLYVTTTLSTKNIEIFGTVPEFTLLFIPLLMAVMLVAFGLRLRRKL
jgi:hypothetical protein